MRPDKFDEPAERSRHRGGGFELFYYERVGARYYLRFTRLALILVVCLTAVPVAAIFALFLTQSHADLKNVNIDVRVPERAPGDYPQLIQPPPAGMPAPPKASRGLRGSNTTRQAPAAPALNANAPLTPTPTSTPTPLRPPG